MVSEDFAAQRRTVDVHIHLGGGYRLVSEHLLYGTQVGSSLKQMCGKAVAQGVRAHRFLYSSQGT